MIIFHEVTYQNFLSSGNYLTTIQIDTRPVTLLIGANGAGKSTFLDALVFGLFGKPFRDVKKGQLVNTVTGKNTVVTVKFSIGPNHYIVTRGIKPNIFTVQYGEDLIPCASATELQEWLDRVLNTTYDAFCQVVVLGKASYIPFMKLIAKDRRQIVENILDLEIFSVMNVLAKKLFVTKEKEFFTAQNEVDILEPQLKLLQEVENAAKEDFEAENTKLAQEADFLQLAVTNLEVEIAQANEIAHKEIEGLQHKAIKTRDFITAIKTKQYGVIAEISNLAVASVCPTCFQNISQEHREVELANREVLIAKYETDLNKLHDINKKTLKELDEAQKFNRDRDAIVASFEMVRREELAKLAAVKRQIATLLSKTTVSTSIEKVEEIESQLLNAKMEANGKKYNRTVVQELLKLLKDDGIKAQIVSQYVEIINQLINGYLEKLNFLCQFNLDEEFNETIKSRFRDEFTYNSFSEGEKLRIDLAILFTFREIARRRNSLNTNILILDEILGSSLDDQGTSDLVTIIRDLTSGQNTFIMSHNDRDQDRVKDVLRFEKVQGFSHVKSID